ncbi:phosphate ABC transporter permease subunit PstC [Mariprofundus sp. EBB-1]|uniref:phosphate ABC transporter permease subunit PstC n=1 Tax=Mariprofundus sp. EBB-1 TaxID=2650971 RepID=UPI000EF266C2|nr:phosphate ABC transporter permease subunit PstC [Mariprofundus sp. EBB-1]RLL55526.1 phosphate ABC transporter permease subunit PstC [Mariprofundus sp. EBB-1]
MSIADLFLWFFGGLLPLSAMAYFLARGKAITSEKNNIRMHSRPGFYGWYTVIWVALPALATSLIFSIGHLFHLFSVPATMLLATAFALGGAGMWFALGHIKADFRARPAVEKVMRGVLLSAAIISILTTLGIVLSVIFESIRFFQVVPVWDFITGTQWQPDTAFLIGAGRAESVGPLMFGSLPIFAGTFMITLIAMLVAIPIGLFAAIYMSEYASHASRGRLKPLLEILAGIPTVVYGFFAAITISPIIVEIAHSFGLEADYTNALAPGLIMGIMIIPFISSLSDDVIRAVPQSMRDGSLALGTTKAETIRHIVLPAAFPGIVAACLLAVSRAIGETMIVVMAAGLRPNLTANPLEGMTTVTVKIVEALTGDQEFDSAFTLSAFALGLVLLIITLMLNIVSTIVVRKFRQRYE